MLRGFNSMAGQIRQLKRERRDLNTRLSAAQASLEWKRSFS